MVQQRRRCANPPDAAIDDDAGTSTAGQEGPGVEGASSHIFVREEDRIHLGVDDQFILPRPIVQPFIGVDNPNREAVIRKRYDPILLVRDDRSDLGRRVFGFLLGPKLR